jgi:NAD(P)-dependent dehydrogenase (short-subunit alcohol dehydrogenase family)
LTQAGASVVFSGRREAKLQEAIAEAGGGFPVVADICEPAQCERLVAEAVGHLGGLDLIVIAASAGRLLMLADATGDDWLTMMRSNVIGPSLVTRAALPHLAPNSVVAFLSSESVGTPYHGLVPYTTSKAAMEETVRGWREEQPDIRFCCVTVGATDDTDFSRDFDMDLAIKLFPEWVGRAKIPAKMMKSPELGTAIADTLATVLVSPGLNCDQITFRAPGGPLREGIESMLNRVEETTSTSGG